GDQRPHRSREDRRGDPPVPDAGGDRPEGGRCLAPPQADAGVPQDPRPLLRDRPVRHGEGMSSPREAMRQSLRIPEDLAADVAATLDGWRAGEKVRRLWSRDATLWTGADEAKWLGWLDVAEDRAAHLKRL